MEDFACIWKNKVSDAAWPNCIMPQLFAAPIPEHCVHRGRGDAHITLGAFGMSYILLPQAVYSAFSRVSFTFLVMHLWTALDHSPTAACRVLIPLHSTSMCNRHCHLGQGPFSVFFSEPKKGVYI